MYPSVTFETKCWENDWELLLKTGRIKVMVQRNSFQFTKKSLFINNVNNYKRVSYHAQKLVDQGVLTDFHIVRDYEEEALKFFSLSKESLGRGYVYSIAELVSIYICQTEFLLHFSGDTIPSNSVSGSWIEAALRRFKENSQVKVANLTWNYRYDQARKESFAEDHEFFVGYGFSDQMYLVRTSDFKYPIYNEVHPMSTRYPSYGGELFEKRVDSWMRNHDNHRLTYKHGSYIHKNFPKKNLKRKICMYFGRYDR